MSQNSSGGGGRFDYRTKHRQRAHDEAHADDGPIAETHIPDAVAAPRGKPELVTSDAQLAELLTHLRTAGSFAYDSEFIGESSYHPKLCLLQVATTERIGLIDPMAEMKLAPFWELLADASIEKVVHAGAQDVEPVYRYIGKPAANLIDTQIAAGFVGMAYPTSLSKLIGELTGILLQKGLTFTHWDQRPLSSKQLRYAADDVRYLPAAAIELKKRLAQTGHMKWVRAECDELSEPMQYVFSPETAVEKVRGSGSLDASRLNVLAELVVWRDAAARDVNVPARAYLRDEVMIDLCRNLPKKLDQLNRIKGLPRPVISDEGESICALVVRGLAAPTEGVESLRSHEPTPSQKFAADVLWTATQALCHSQSIDPAVVTSRQAIGELHRALVNGESFDDLRLMTGWRREAVGDRLVAMWREGESVSVALPKPITE